MAEEEGRDSFVTTQEGMALYDRNKLGPAFFGVLFLSSLAALAYTLAAFVHDIVLALVVVALFRPFYLRLAGLLGGRRWVASAIVTSSVVLLVVTPITLLAGALIRQGRLALGALVEFLRDASKSRPPDWLVDPLNQLLSPFGVRLSLEQLNAALVHVGEAAQESVFAAGGSVLSNVLALFIHAAVSIVIVFYLLVDADRLRDFLFKLSPLPDEEEALFVKRFQDVARGTLVGNGIGSVAQAALCSLAMWAVDLPSPLFWGAVMSVFAFLPLVGVSIIVIPMGVYLYFTASGTTALAFLVFCLGQAAIFENIVKTKLIGAGAAMPDLLAFLAIVGGLGVFGVLGILYGPLIATAFLTLSDLYFQQYRRTLALNYVGRAARK